MRKLTYKITEETETTQNIYYVEFDTDRTPEWTEEQYLRHRRNAKMELVSDEETKEEQPVSREIKLG